MKLPKYDSFFALSGLACSCLSTDMQNPDLFVSSSQNNNNPILSLDSKYLGLDMNVSLPDMNLSEFVLKEVCYDVWL